MADFFFSVPGALACAGVGALCLIRRPRGGVRAIHDGPDVRLIMQVGISIVILAAGLWVILTDRYSVDAQRWAAGAVGTVVGYWLKP
jgi:hypothetical protein